MDETSLMSASAFSGVHRLMPCGCDSFCFLLR
jgi:hypothetical protein